MFSVYQHWDKLKTCVVGRSYPPEYYSWVKDTKARKYFETLAIQTEEDFQTLIAKLEQFGVKVLRPEVNTNDPFSKPPVAPRDQCVMIGETFYSDIEVYDFNYFYYNIREEGWPWISNASEIDNLPTNIRNKCVKLHNDYVNRINGNGWQHIFTHIKEQGNQIKTFVDPHLTGPMVSRIGCDLYVGTYSDDEDTSHLQHALDTEFPTLRTHLVDTGGHSDGTYCPVTPGLIISHWDMPTYQDTFPNWEVLYLPQPKYNYTNVYNSKWWMPGANEQTVADTVQKYMKHWVGNSAETIFDVNMLIIDPKNVIMIAYNQQVVDKLAEYGITAHIVPFRHRYFWDGGIHCITNDLDREGTIKDYFPGRQNEI